MVFSNDGGTNWQNDANLDVLMTGAGAFQYQTHRRARRDPQLLQMVRQLIGPGVKFSKSQLAFRVFDCYPIGRCSYMRFKQLMDKEILWMVDSGRVPFYQLLVQFRFAQQRQSVYCLIKILGNGLQQVLQVTC